MSLIVFPPDWLVLRVSILCFASSSYCREAKGYFMRS